MDSISLITKTISPNTNRRPEHKPKDWYALDPSLCRWQFQLKLEVAVAAQKSLATKIKKKTVIAF